MHGIFFSLFMIINKLPIFLTTIKEKNSPQKKKKIPKINTSPQRIANNRGQASSTMTR